MLSLKRIQQHTVTSRLAAIDSAIQNVMERMQVYASVSRERIEDQDLLRDHAARCVAAVLAIVGAK